MIPLFVKEVKEIYMYVNVTLCRIVQKISGNIQMAQRKSKD